MSEFKPCVVLTTVADDKVKQTIIEQVLQQQLAACIQEMPITSHYVWQEAVCHDAETLLVIKTQMLCYERLEQLIDSLHDYDTPQIVMLPIEAGADPYLMWLQATTR